MLLELEEVFRLGIVASPKTFLGATTRDIINSPLIVFSNIDEMKRRPIGRHLCDTNDRSKFGPLVGINVNTTLMIFSVLELTYLLMSSVTVLRLSIIPKYYQ